MRREHTTFRPAAPPDAVRAWRREQLVAAGVRRERAQQLADDARWDLHALLELVGRGCPPELAERIVAPLDAGPGGC
ncbi:MAG: hypothetical protein JSS99_16280 [Actinobacteria bacterium]|nr:hypothetical protein [Actinomycetota bacterium]